MASPGAACHLSQAPGFAHRAQLAQLVGLVVVDEHLGLGISVEFAAGFDRDVGEVADGGDAVADIDRE